MRWSLLTIAFMPRSDSSRAGGTTPRSVSPRTGVLYPLSRRSWMAGRCVDGLTRARSAVRQLAEDYGAAARSQPGADHRGEQHGRRDGKNDRRTEHRRGNSRDESARPVGSDPAVRLLAQRRPRHDHGRHRDAAGVRVPVDGAKVAVTGSVICGAGSVGLIGLLLPIPTMFTDP